MGMCLIQLSSWTVLVSLAQSVLVAVPVPDRCVMRWVLSCLNPETKEKERRGGKKEEQVVCVSNGLSYTE